MAGRERPTSNPEESDLKSAGDTRLHIMVATVAGVSAWTLLKVQVVGPAAL